MIIIKLKGYDFDDPDSETEISTYNALMTGGNPLGGLFGAFLGTYVLKLCGGLKKGFILTDIIGIIGTIIVICNLDFANIIIGRFV